MPLRNLPYPHNRLFMKTFGIVLLILGMLIWFFPDMLRFLVAFFFIFTGANILAATTFFGPKRSEDEPIRFGGYEIYRGKRK